jgi:hypothetical protein
MISAFATNKTECQILWGHGHMQGHIYMHKGIHSRSLLLLSRDRKIGTIKTMTQGEIATNHQCKLSSSAQGNGAMSRQIGWHHMIRSRLRHLHGN